MLTNLNGGNSTRSAKSIAFLAGFLGSNVIAYNPD